MPDSPSSRRPARRRWLALALALAAGVPGVARAQWPLPSAGLPVCTAAGTQVYRTAISDGAGGMFVAWADTRFVVSDIYAQHVSASGTVLWTTDGTLACGAPGRQDQPVLAPDGAGGIYVAWRDVRNDPEGDIYLTHLGPDGISQWTYNGIAVCNATGQQTAPALAPDTTGGAPWSVVVAWEDYRRQPSIYAQRITPDGDPMWTANGVRVTASLAPQYEPALVGGGDQGTIVAWSQQGLNGYDIFAEEIGHDGQPLWAATGQPVCAAAGNQFHPAVVSDSAGGAWVTWEDDRATSLAIYAERLTSYGMPVIGGDGLAVCGVNADQTSPVATADTRGGVILAWQDARANADVYAQRLDPTGARLWPATGLPVCTGGGTHAFPSVAADGLGGAILAWEDTRSGADIYAQRVDSTGAPVWAVNGVGVCTASATQYQATVVTSPDTAGIVIWNDLRGNSDLYCNRVPWVLVGLRAPAPLASSPNPARDEASFAFAMPAAGRARLTIYDTAGRRVRDLPARSLAAGAQRLGWDARDEAGRACADGVYFARLEVDGRPFASSRVTLRR